MNKIQHLIFVSFLLLFTACQYDDSKLWSEIQDIEEQLHAHSQKILYLENLCNELNTNVTAIQAILDAVENRDYITSVSPVSESGTEVGFVITFSSGKAVTIFHGKDGLDGSDGVDGNDAISPVVGVKKDIDGVYYWTLNGDWLLDSEGNKIKAAAEDGKDAVVPQFKIEDEYWYVSYDNKVTWERLASAVPELEQTSNCFFKEIVIDDDCVNFVLLDGSSFKLPLLSAISLIFSQEGTFECYPGVSFSLSFDIIGASGAITAECICEGAIAAQVSVMDNEGNITVTPDDSFDNGRILLFVNDELGRIVMKSLSFVKADDTNVNYVEQQIGFDGGIFTFPIASDAEYQIVIPAQASEWLTQVNSIRKDLLAFSVTENSLDSPREAVFQIIIGDETTIISVFQRANPMPGTYSVVSKRNADGTLNDAWFSLTHDITWMPEYNVKPQGMDFGSYTFKFNSHPSLTAYVLCAAEIQFQDISNDLDAKIRYVVSLADDVKTVKSSDGTLVRFEHGNPSNGAAVVFPSDGSVTFTQPYAFGDGSDRVYIVYRQEGNIFYEPIPVDVPNF